MAKEKRRLVRCVKAIRKVEHQVHLFDSHKADSEKMEKVYCPGYYGGIDDG